MRSINTYRAICCLTFFSVVGIDDVFAQDDRKTYKAYEIEASYIYNFIDFVNWPDRASRDTLVIGILGDDEFGNAFAPVDGSLIGNKILSVRKSYRIEDLKNCSILYITASEASRVKSIIETLDRRPVLTVSNMEGFTGLGGMIQFYTTELGGDTKVRFDINKERVDEAGLKMSFRLLSLAKSQK